MSGNYRVEQKAYQRREPARGRRPAPHRGTRTAGIFYTCAQILRRITACANALHRCGMHGNGGKRAACNLLIPVRRQTHLRCEFIEEKERSCRPSAGQRSPPPRPLPSRRRKLPPRARSARAPSRRPVRPRQQRRKGASSSRGELEPRRGGSAARRGEERRVARTPRARRPRAPHRGSPQRAEDVPQGRAPRGR